MNSAFDMLHRVTALCTFVVASAFACQPATRAVPGHASNANPGPAVSAGFEPNVQSASATITGELLRSQVARFSADERRFGNCKRGSRPHLDPRRRVRG